MPSHPLPFHTHTHTHTHTQNTHNHNNIPQSEFKRLQEGDFPDSNKQRKKMLRDSPPGSSIHGSAPRASLELRQVRGMGGIEGEREGKEGGKRGGRRRGGRGEGKKRCL